ncbi:MAG: DUF4845 domain-containing protein, partial [Steroidobacteraceae bacterium]
RNMAMRSRQLGMTFMGFVVLAVVVGGWVYAGIRLTPLYLNYMKVASSLERVRDEYSASPGTSQAMIRNSLRRIWDVESVDENVFPLEKLVIKREGDFWKVQAQYDDKVRFVSNVYLMIAVDKVVEIPIS